jgi:hypothetical protein
MVGRVMLVMRVIFHIESPHRFFLVKPSIPDGEHHGTSSIPILH